MNIKRILKTVKQIQFYSNNSVLNDVIKIITSTVADRREVRVR